MKEYFIVLNAGIKDFIYNFKHIGELGLFNSLYSPLYIFDMIVPESSN